jgi:hypothetical protein
MIAAEWSEANKKTEPVKELKKKEDSHKTRDKAMETFKVKRYGFDQANKVSTSRAPPQPRCRNGLK